jgi:hypothetical protein
VVKLVLSFESFDMFGAAKKRASRVGLKPVRVLFSIQVESVILTRLSPVKDEAVVSVCFERGGKVSSTSNVTVEKPAYTREVVIPFNEKIELVATVYKDVRTGRFQEKVGKLIFRELDKGGLFGHDGYKGIGKCSLLLHKLMDELGYERTMTKEQTIKFDLVPGTSMKMVITATAMSSGSSVDEDGQSVASYMSAESDLSTIAASFAYTPAITRDNTLSTMSSHESGNTSAKHEEESPTSETGSNSKPTEQKQGASFFRKALRKLGGSTMSNLSNSTTSSLSPKRSGAKDDTTAKGGEADNWELDRSNHDHGEAKDDPRSESPEFSIGTSSADPTAHHQCKQRADSTAEEYSVDTTACASPVGYPVAPQPEEASPTSHIGSAGAERSSRNNSTRSAGSGSTTSTEHIHSAKTSPVSSVWSAGNSDGAHSVPKLTVTGAASPQRHTEDTVPEVDAQQDTEEHSSSSGHHKGLVARMLKPLRAAATAASAAVGHSPHAHSGEHSPVTGNGIGFGMSRFTPTLPPLGGEKKTALVGPLTSSTMDQPSPFVDPSAHSPKSQASREAFALYDEELRRRAEVIQQLQQALAQQAEESNQQMQELRAEVERTASALRREKIARRVIADTTHHGDNLLAAALSEARDQAESANARYYEALAEVRAVREELAQSRLQVLCVL